MYFKKQKPEDSIKNNIVDNMIEGMVNGIIDVDGKPLNSTMSRPENKKMGYTGIQILTLVSLISSTIIAILGIIFIFITK